MRQASSRSTILIASPNRVRAKNLARLSARLGYAAIFATADDVGEQIAKWRPHAALVEQTQDRRGVSLAHRMRDEFRVPVILLVPHVMRPRAVADPDLLTLSLPVRASELNIALRAALRQHETEARLNDGQGKYRALQTLVERNTREFSALSRAGQAVLTSLDPKVVLNQVLEQVFPLLEGAEGLSILLRRGAMLEFAAVRGAGEKELIGKQMPANVGIAGRVLASGESLRVTERDAHLMYHEIEELTGYRARDMIAAPLRVGEATIGVIEAVHRQAGKFSDDHLRLLNAAGNWAAIAIENARLFNQVETAKKEWEDSVDSLAEGIALVDADYRVVRVNRALAKWLGTTPQKLVGEMCYRAIDDCDAPPDSCPHAQVIRAAARKRQAEIELTRLGKTFQFTSYSIDPTNVPAGGSVNVLQDVTSEKFLQAQLIQTEKLAATGRLAASVAHEINNPLQAIQGCLDLAEANLGDPTKEQRYLTMAQGELTRLANFVQRLLEFYRTGKGTRVPADVRPILDDVLTLNRKRVQEGNVRVQTEWPEALPNVSIVRDQIQHVFLNLILNAVDAMPRGGDLKISGKIVEDEWLTIAFADTGIGIAPGDLGKIFEPFFTTKTKGTGLGLGISQNILTSQRGHLTVESTQGKGSTFTVWLPLY